MIELSLYEWFMEYRQHFKISAANNQVAENAFFAGAMRMLQICHKNKDPEYLKGLASDIDDWLHLYPDHDCEHCKALRVQGLEYSVRKDLFPDS